MHYLKRHLTERLQGLASHFPSVVVSGARQVGKSTLVQHVFGQTHRELVFDPVADVGNARADPDLFLDNNPPPLILDEIQYAPELVPALKRRIDRDRSPGQYILTGSQQWGAMRSVAESLAGRTVFVDLEGFSLAEIAERPGGWLQRWIEDPEALAGDAERLPLPHRLYEQLWRGFLPEAQDAPEEYLADFHEAYRRTYLERDVRAMGEVSNLQTFVRFLRLMAALTAQEINYSQLGRELGLNPQTAKRWLGLLTATFQWFEVPAYSGNAVKRLSGRPKGHMADTGVACAAQVIASPTALGGHPLLGPLFETAVAAEVRKQCALMSPRPAMYHWRTQSGAEVDLLLERDGRFYPIEVKVKSNPSRRDASGILAFRKTYPNLDIAPGLVVAPTDAVRKISDEDYCLPWDSVVPDS